MIRMYSFFVTAVLLTACGVSTPVDEVFFVRSRDADMPVWVRGESSSNVAIVFVAGGPGAPAMYYEELEAFRRLEKSVIVAFWDQRISGGASGDVTSDSLTLEQFAVDLDAVVQVMQRRYGDQSIFLLGHSWGGLVGHAHLADATRRSRIAGWIDVDGVHNYPKSYELVRDWTMQELQVRIDAGDDAAQHRKDLAWLEAHPIARCSDLKEAGKKSADLDPWSSNGAGGLGSLWLNLFSPFDGLSTLTNAGRVQDEISDDDSALCQALLTDVSAELPSITVPSLVVWGRHDLAPVSLGEEAHALLGAFADQKSMLVLENAGHNCFIDEPDEFAEAVEDFTAAWAR